MAIHRRPPHPMRGPITLLIVLAVVVVGMILLSRSAKEVPTHPIEADVALPAAR